MEMLELQNQFAVRVAGCVKSPWDEIRVHYENAEIDGVPREVFSASRVLNGTKQNVRLPLEALDLLAKLREHKPEGQLEGWVWLEFLIDNTGKYRFDYKYDKPPMIMEQVKYSK